MSDQMYFEVPEFKIVSCKKRHRIAFIIFHPDAELMAETKDLLIWMIRTDSTGNIWLDAQGD